MKFEDTSVYNIYNAILGARNPMNSWNKSDSVFKGFNGKIEDTEIGKNDLELAQRLIKAGSEHRKFLRQIFVSVTITAPLYWWKEADQYKVGTTTNSTSTMHRLASTPITKDCFEMDDFEDVEPFDEYGRNAEEGSGYTFELYLTFLEELRLAYLKTKNKKYWKELIRMLPESWLQKRTVTMNYENLLAMCSKGQRRNHKLTEWSKSFIDWARGLPYAQELIFIDEVKE